MDRRFFLRTQRLFLCLIVLYAFFLYGCSPVKFISDYDETIDKQVTELYRNISIYMQDLVNIPSVTGPDSIVRAAKYNGIQLEIGMLKLRVSAKDKNEEQIQQLDLLINSWDNIAKLQALNATSKEFKNAESALDISLTAILKLELAKKKS